MFRNRLDCFRNSTSGTTAWHPCDTHVIRTPIYTRDTLLSHFAFAWVESVQYDYLCMTHVWDAFSQKRKETLHMPRKCWLCLKCTVRGRISNVAHASFHNSAFFKCEGFYVWMYLSRSCWVCGWRTLQDPMFDCQHFFNVLFIQLNLSDGCTLKLRVLNCPSPMYRYLSRYTIGCAQAAILFRVSFVAGITFSDSTCDATQRKLNAWVYIRMLEGWRQHNDICIIDRTEQPDCQPPHADVVTKEYSLRVWGSFPLHTFQ